MISKIGSSESKGQANFVKFSLSCEMTSLQHTPTHAGEKMYDFIHCIGLFFRFCRDLMVCHLFQKIIAHLTAHFPFHYFHWLFLKTIANCFKKLDQSKILYVVSQWSISECVSMLVKKVGISTILVLRSEILFLDLLLRLQQFFFGRVFYQVMQILSHSRFEFGSCKSKNICMHKWLIIRKKISPFIDFVYTTVDITQCPTFGRIAVEDLLHNELKSSIGRHIHLSTITFPVDHLANDKCK